MRSDFVKVKLTDAGERHGQGGPVRVIEAWLDETFTSGVAHDCITKLDWERVLQHYVHEGEPMFCVVSDEESPVASRQSPAEEDEKK